MAAPALNIRNAVGSAAAARPRTTGGVLRGARESIIEKTLQPLTEELLRLFPDGLIVVSGLFALFTLSYPYAVFFASMCEASLIQNILQRVTTYLGISSTSPTDESYTRTCKSGYLFKDLSSLSLFSNPAGTAFPSPQIFMLTAAAGYIMATLNALAKELEALGPAYANRYYMSVVFLFALLFVFLAFRMYHHCDTLGVILMTVLFGTLVGFMIAEQNRRLFGIESLNLIGIQILRNLSTSGRPMNICTKK